MSDTTTTAVEAYKAPVISEKLNLAVLSADEALQLNDSYAPFLARLNNQHLLANKIDFADPMDIDMTISRELRLATVKIRTECEKIKASRKELHQTKANIEQLAYNIISKECEELEAKLSAVENAAKIKETARKNALRLTRMDALKEFDTDLGAVKVEDLTDDAWEMLLDGLKRKKEAVAIAAAKAEADRIEAEFKVGRTNDRMKTLLGLGAKEIDGFMTLAVKGVENTVTSVGMAHIEDCADDLFVNIVAEVKAAADKNIAYDKAIAEENTRLKSEAEAKAKSDASEKIAAQKKQDTYNTRLESLIANGGGVLNGNVKIFDCTKDENWVVSSDELLNIPDAEFDVLLNTFSGANKNNLAQLAQTAAAIEADNKAAADKLAAETAKANALAAELDAKKKAEDKANADAAAKIIADEKAKKKELAAPDKVKLRAFGNSLVGLALPDLKSEEAKAIMKATSELLVKTRNYIIEKSEQL